MANKMNPIRWYVLVLVFLLSLIACNKRIDSVNGSNTPIFKFNGSIGNEQLNLQAGVNRMYMFTNYFKDSQSLWTLEGTFASDSCATCEPYLSFNLKDIETTLGSTLSKDYAELFKDMVLTSYSIDSIITTTPTEEFNFISDPTNPTGTQYFWDFGDGTTSTLANPVHIFPVFGDRVVRLATSYNNFKDTIENIIDASLNSTCRVQFTTSGTPDSLLCSAPSGFQSYLWTFGNGTVSAIQNPDVSFTQPGFYTINLNATKAGCNNTMSFKRKVAVQQLLGSYCLSNYFYDVTNSTVTTFQPRINKNAFIITYKKNGKTYYSYKPSKFIDQSNVPIFTLEDLNLYIPNEKNQSTLWVKGKVDTWLYNTNDLNDSLRMVSSELKFALAFPR